MRTTAITPHITVAIGQQVRLYHAYITTAPATLDAPSTMTLYESTVTDLAGFAIDPDGLDTFRPRTPRASCSSTPSNSPGNAPVTARRGTSSPRQTRCSSA